MDSVAVRWFDGFINHDDIKLDTCSLFSVDEIDKPTGSCPYLYSWDGTGFRFVTDLLGAAPVGLRLSDTQFIHTCIPEPATAIGAIVAACVLLLRRPLRARS